MKFFLQVVSQTRQPDILINQRETDIKPNISKQPNRKNVMIKKDIDHSKFIFIVYFAHKPYNKPSL